MKRRPSVRAPGRAAKRNPGPTCRESADNPRMSSAVLIVMAWSSLDPSKSSLRRIRRGVYRRQQWILRFWRVVGDRRHAEQRRHALNDPADHRGGDPAAGGETV